MQAPAFSVLQDHKPWAVNARTLKRDYVSLLRNAAWSDREVKRIRDVPVYICAVFLNDGKARVLATISFQIALDAHKKPKSFQ